MIPSNSDPNSPELVKVRIEAKSYIGIIGVSPNLTIVVNPKIGHADFIATLEHVDAKKVQLWQTLARNVEVGANFVEFFFQVFLAHVEELLVSQKRRGYQFKAGCLPRPAGRILVGKTLRAHKPHAPGFHCAYFDFSADTPHNQVIKHTLHYIRRVIPPALLPAFRRAWGLLHDVTLQPWSPHEIGQIRYDRLTTAYQPLHEFCALILAHFSLEFAEGSHGVYSFVMNAWNVYEIFLCNLFRRFQARYKVDAYKIHSLVEEIDWMEKPDSRPDIILSTSSHFVSVLDAKYKFQFQPRDRDQVFRYIGLHSLTIGFLLYPQIANSTQEDDIIYEFHHGQFVTVHVRYIDLARVKDRNYVRKFISDCIAAINLVRYCGKSTRIGLNG